jgi:hypothetical protein
MSLLKKIGIGIGAVVVLVLLGGGLFVWKQASAFDASMSKVYPVPVTEFQRVTDPVRLERGKHLVESMLGCQSADCHGKDLGGGKVAEFGPIGTITGPNITGGGLGAAYSDGELLRLLQHGVRKDGTSVRFMPMQDIYWVPRADLEAVVSYVRTVPSVNKPNGPISLGIMAKVLDQKDLIPIDIARRIDHDKAGQSPPPAPTAEYGSYIGKTCTGCHGATLSGGPIPGAPSEFPPPLNLTPHATGMAGWTYEDFDKLLVQGIRKNGKKLDPFMPIDSFGKLDDTEKHALFAYLQSLPPREYGGR